MSEPIKFNQVETSHLSFFSLLMFSPCKIHFSDVGHGFLIVHFPLQIFAELFFSAFSICTLEVLGKFLPLACRCLTHGPIVSACVLQLLGHRSCELRVWVCTPVYFCFYKSFSPCLKKRQNQPTKAPSPKWRNTGLWLWWLVSQALGKDVSKYSSYLFI